MTTLQQPQIDVNVPRFNQGAVALLTGLAFLTGWWGLVVVAWFGVAANRLVGPAFGPFTILYTRLVRPRVTTVTTEWGAPPRFSQLLAVIFLGGAVVLFVADLDLAGWTITALVTALATLAAAARICVGCILYEWFVSR